MGYVALLCVSAQALTVYGSFIEAQPQTSFYLILFFVVELYLHVCSCSIPASKITLTK